MPGAMPGQRRRRGLLAVVVFALGLIAAGWLQVEPLDRPAALSHLDDGEVAVIAHAGAQGHAPPNTMEAFDLALELGADTLEMDLQVTADGHLATIHDGTVDRTTDGSGSVAELTLAELQALDAGATWTDGDGSTPFAGQGVRHASLDEVLTAFPDTPLVIELKTDGGTAIIQPTIDLLVDHGRDDGTVVVTPRFTRAAERLGVDVQVWTVNDPVQMHRILDAGAHGIMTDYPDRAVEVLAERAVSAEQDPGGFGAQLDLIERLQDTAPWATPIFAVLTFLGDEEFYLLVLPVLYWAISRHLGIRIGVMLLLSAGINGIGKLITVTPRPSFLRPSLGVVSETSFGVPSGHAQNAVAIWGLLAATARSWWIRGALVVLIAGIAWSRFHLGVHFVEDLVVGALMGIVLLVAFLSFEHRVAGWWRRIGMVDQMLTAVAASLVLIAPAVLLAGRLVGVDPGWPGLQDPATLAQVAGASAVVTPAAALAGFGVGLSWLEHRGGFMVAGSVRQRVVRVLVGLIGVVAIVEGLGAVLPSGEEPLALLSRYVRYGLTGAWIAGIAPALFVRLGLAATDGVEPAPDTGVLR